MTRKEFDQWFKHFVSAFPAANDHVCKVDPTGRDTLGHWFAVLEKRELADALSVTNGVFSGDLAGFADAKGFIDWSAVPRHVSRLCGEQHKIVPEWKREAERPVAPGGIIAGDAPMATAYAKAMKILAENGTMDDVRAMLKVEFPVGSARVEAFDEWNNG